MPFFFFAVQFKSMFDSGMSESDDSDGIFRVTLDFSLLGSILVTIHDCQTISPNLAFSVMRALSHSNRFEFTYSCLSDEEKSAARSIFCRLSQALSVDVNLHFTPESLLEVQTKYTV